MPQDGGLPRDATVAATAAAVLRRARLAEHGRVAPDGAAAVHDEDVGRQAEHEGRVERQVLVVGAAAVGVGSVGGDCRKLKLS